MPQKYLSYHAPGMKVSYGLDEIPDDSHFFLHVHDNYEIHCVISGKVGYVVEGRIYDLRPGSVVIMRSAETHKLLINKKEPYERYTLNFRPEVLTEHGFPPEILTAFHDRNLGEQNLYPAEAFQNIEPAGMFRQMFLECAHFDPEGVLLSNLVSLLYAINAVFIQQKDQPTNHTGAYNVERQLIDYINKHLLEDLSLTVISEEIHMSPSQINRIFHNLTGTSVYRYILSKRLIIAQEMIAGGTSAIEASQACGFHDYSAFYRLYKKHLGQSPTAAKKKIEQV
ncbi:MAG: AraC family transcriptional regulator [Clostridia bacterium]|nr:AraC family transcriptional regulator [Clostridia bacterium]